MTHALEIAQRDGTERFPCYIAEPAGDASAGVVVIQEAFGVNAGIRRRCDMLAKAGFLAVAPDLFWRVEPGIELDPDIKPELDRGLSLIGDFDQDQAVRDIQSAIDETRRRLPAGAKVGAVGYCIGGKLAYMTAARTDVDAAVGYYAVGVEKMLGEINSIANPFMLHLGGDDQFMKADAQAKVEAAFADNELLQVFIYDGAPHGFATEFGERRLPAAADKADRRTADFFAENLK